MNPLLRTKGYVSVSKSVPMSVKNAQYDLFPRNALKHSTPFGIDLFIAYRMSSSAKSRSHPTPFEGPTTRISRYPHHLSAARDRNVYTPVFTQLEVSDNIVTRSVRRKQRQNV